LRALRADYVAGNLQSVIEIVHADAFADFLDMADYLLQRGYKDAAAVLAGSVLEEHLRKLAKRMVLPLPKVAERQRKLTQSTRSWREGLSIRSSIRRVSRLGLTCETKQLMEDTPNTPKNRWH